MHNIVKEKMEKRAIYIKKRATSSNEKEEKAIYTKCIL